MSLYLTKIITHLVAPLSLAFFLTLLALLLFLLRRRRFAISCLTLGLLWLWICAMPVVASALRGVLEAVHPAKSLAELPEVDAIVVLGGIMSGPAAPYRLHFNLSDSVDRLWHAMRLYKAGKAAQIIVVGGSLPWYQAKQAEAELMAAVLMDLAVPESAILLETTSLNTHQNALYSKALLQAHNMKSILLVTSAWHMPRALASFRSVAINAIPAPIDFVVNPDRDNTFQHWFPDVGALSSTTNSLKEYLGWVYYKYRGWILE